LHKICFVWYKNTFLLVFSFCMCDKSFSNLLLLVHVRVFGCEVCFM
jgi:hypothetical protein